MKQSSHFIGSILGLVGALVGGFAGYHLFLWIAGQGFYALVLPGACLGLGCGALSGHKSIAEGIFCGALGLALGVYSEWQVAPFQADDSFLFFMAHLHENPPVTLIMIALGGVFAFWFGLGRDGGVWRRVGRKE